MLSKASSGRGVTRPPPARTRLSATSLVHDLRVRAWVYQAAVLVGAIALGAFLIGNAQDALHRQGITTGFGFLANPAGFEIGERLIAFDSMDSFARAYGVAVLNTLKVAVASVLLATLLGTVVGLGRLSANLLARRLASMYVEVFRNTPQLVLLIFCYTLLTKLPAPRAALSAGGLAFLSNRGLSIPWVTGDEGPLFVALLLSGGLFWAASAWARGLRHRGAAARSFARAIPLTAALPLILLGFAGPAYRLTLPELRGFNFVGGTVVSPEFLALLLALSFYVSAFIAEIVRSGIQSVDRGQIEAAKAIGLSRAHIFRQVVLPQALRSIVPPAALQYVSIVKNSSLGVAIGYPELFSVNNTIATLSGQVVEAIAIMMTIYLGLSFIVAASLNLYNRAVQLKAR